MILQHLQSSTQILDMGDVKILTDPWLTEGELLGSWFHYPPFEEEKIADLDYDFIYVSHIHPDHVSERTFAALPRVVPVLIHEYDSKFLKKKIERLGFPVKELPHGEPFSVAPGCTVTIFAADNCDPQLCGRFMGCSVAETRFSSTQIDSLAVFETKDFRVVNTNDCPFGLAENTIKSNGLADRPTDLLLVGYAGAGPFPQTFAFDSLESKFRAAELKRKQFLRQAKDFIDLLAPRFFAPFAGTYILGSRLVSLNPWRGVPSVDEAVDWLEGSISSPSKGVRLHKWDRFNLGTGELDSAPNNSEPSYEQYLDEISRRDLDYDHDSWSDDEIDDLASLAYERFKTKCEEIGFSSDTLVRVSTDKVSFEFGTSREIVRVDRKSPVISPFVEISLDHNLLHRLLRGPQYAHWNNAEGGSHLTYRRQPDVFERGLYHSLSFFHA